VSRFLLSLLFSGHRRRVAAVNIAGFKSVSLAA